MRVTELAPIWVHTLRSMPLILQPPAGVMI